MQVVIRQQRGEASSVSSNSSSFFHSSPIFEAGCFAVFDSFPAAGPAPAPRLLAAFGTRRERYAEAAELATYSGIAPVVEC